MNRKVAPFKCPYCDTGIMRPAKVPYEMTFRGKSYTIPDADVMACDKCGEFVFAPGQSDALQRRASDLARKDMGLLTGAEIAAFRKQHGLTQSELERVLGAPRKSVARWEIGSVLQSKTVDTFLRLLMTRPDLLYDLLEAPLEEGIHVQGRKRLDEYVDPEEVLLEQEENGDYIKVALAA